MQSSGNRRQEHGIKSQQVTLTFPGAQLDRLRREAATRGISISWHVRSLIEMAWAVRDNLGRRDDDDSEVA